MKELKGTVSRLKELGEILKKLSYHVSKETISKIFSEYNTILVDLRNRYPGNEVVLKNIMGKSYASDHILQGKYGDVKIALLQEINSVLKSLEEED